MQNEPSNRGARSRRAAAILEDLVGGEAQSRQQRRCQAIPSSRGAVVNRNGRRFIGSGPMAGFASTKGDVVYPAPEAADSRSTPRRRGLPE